MYVAAGCVVGRSYKRMRTAARDAVHMYCNPLKHNFFFMPRSIQYMVEEFINKRCPGDWDIKDVADQFLCPILADWKYNTQREARNYINGKRPQTYKPTHVKEGDWNNIIDRERAKQSGAIVMSHQRGWLTEDGVVRRGQQLLTATQLLGVSVSRISSGGGSGGYPHLRK